MNRTEINDRRCEINNLLLDYIVIRKDTTVEQAVDIYNECMKHLKAIEEAIFEECIDDYTDLKYDYDYHYHYRITRDDVHSANWSKYKEISDLAKKFDNDMCAITNSLYYKGTSLYFTYKDEKYYISWHFLSYDLINQFRHDIKELGARNIITDYGELD